MSYNRYNNFKVNNEIKIVPFIQIAEKAGDKEEIYELGVTRLDNLSYKYYKDANYGWLIQQANTGLGSLEFNIPNGSRIRIPYPLETTIKEYQASIETYIKYYGI